MKRLRDQIFGCVANVYISDEGRNTLDPKSKVCAFMVMAKISLDTAFGIMKVKRLYFQEI